MKLKGLKKVKWIALMVGILGSSIKECLLDEEKGIQLEGEAWEGKGIGRVVGSACSKIRGRRSCCACLHCEPSINGKMSCCACLHCEQILF